MSRSELSTNSSAVGIASDDRLPSNDRTSSISFKSEVSSSSVGELIRESQALQNEINSIFAELSDINRQVKIDIDEFCHIGLHSTSSMLNASRSN